MSEKSEKITQELVFDLADSLIAKGIDPTNLRIREMNGNRGSLSSITPLLKAWREQRTSDAIEAIPDMPSERLLGVLQPVWAELAREAQATFKAEQAAFEQERKTYAEEIATYIVEIDRQSELLEQTHTALNNAAAESQQQKQQLAVLSERVEQQTLRFDAQLRENDILHAELTQLATEHKAVNEQLSFTKKSLSDKETEIKVAESNIAGLNEKLNSYQQQVDEQKQAIKLSIQAHAELERVNATLAVNLDNARTDFKNANEVLTSTKVALDEQVIANKVAENKMADLYQQFNASQVQIKEQLHTITLITQTSAEHERNNAILTAKLENETQYLAEVKAALLKVENVTMEKELTLNQALMLANSRADIAEGKLSALLDTPKKR